MTPFEVILLFVAAMLAGALNSVAGGGSFISFPALTFARVPIKEANITNTIALWPGSIASVGAYRNEFTKQRGLIPMVIVSLIGGVLGAILLANTPEPTFGQLLPWLLLLATSLFVFGRRLTKVVRGQVSRLKMSTAVITVVVLVLQMVVAIYGGFFGGGIGIMMLAVLSLAGMENIHSMNALKTLLATCINGAAVVVFVLSGKVWWPQGILMVAGAMVGGYAGAHYAQKVDPELVRKFVIVVACSMTVYFFLQRY